MVGRIFGRWLLASLALGAVGGGLYGVVVASTLGGPDEAAIISEAPVAMVLGIGLGIGSILGIVGGILLGVVLGVIMGLLNRRLSAVSSAHYVRRVRVVAVLVPVVLGVAVLTVVDRLATLDLLPVGLAGAAWGLAARRIAEGYRGFWPPRAQQ